MYINMHVIIILQYIEIQQSLFSNNITFKEYLAHLIA